MPFLCLASPVVTSTSISLSSNKIQSGDILVPANPGPPGKMAVKNGESISVYLSVLSELGLEDGQELYVADPTSPNSLVFRLQLTAAME